MSMKSNAAFQRLQIEYRNLKKNPIPYLTAQPLANNILEWRFVIRGPSETPYEDGIYQGKIVFPIDYPFKPPSIYMITPNGRFKTNTSLCLNITSFHPDSWQPCWSMGSILNGFLSFMCDSSSTFGSIETSCSQKRKFAYDSLSFNMRDPTFCELFPEITEEIVQKLAERSSRESQTNSTSQNFSHDQQRSSNSDSSNLHSTDSSWLNSFFSNIMILVLLAIFAIVVRFILNSTTEV